MKRVGLVLLILVVAAASVFAGPPEKPKWVLAAKTVEGWYYTRDLGGPGSPDRHKDYLAISAVTMPGEALATQVTLISVGGMEVAEASKLFFLGTDQSGTLHFLLQKAYQSPDTVSEWTDLWDKWDNSNLEPLIHSVLNYDLPEDVKDQKPLYGKSVTDWSFGDGRIIATLSALPTIGVRVSGDPLIF